MRHIQFKSISVKNFLSIGRNPVIVDFKQGVNLITGLNHDKEDSKNGVGKSSVLDGLYFALFGSTIRDISKDLIVNSTNKEKCEVILNLQITCSSGTNTYVITRTIQPNKCTITKDGVDVTRSTLPKTNEYIQQLINSTGKIFQNSVVMSINSTVPFMAQTKVDKRKFIESVLKLEVFSEMLVKVREEHSELKRDYEVMYARLQSTEKSLQTNKQQLDLFEITKQSRIADSDRRIQDAQKNIEALRKQIVSIPSDIETKIHEKELELDTELDNAEDKYNKINSDVIGLNAELNLVNSEIKDIEKVGAVCNSCKRPYPENDTKHREESKKTLQLKHNKINTKLLTLRKTLEEALKNRNDVKDKIKKLSSKKEGIVVYMEKNRDSTNKISFIQVNIKQHEDDKTKIAAECNSLLEKTVTDLTGDFTTQSESLNTIDSKLSVLECVKFVVSEEGVKSYIVKKILKILNTRLAYYLDELQANCICQFDEFFDEKITDEKNEEKSYFNFSGGERKRIDLACLFAFLDIRRMQGDINFSTIFYDELLDSSLDDKGVELVVKVLRERQIKHNESCYIITHRSNALNSKVDSTLTLEKRNGFTYILSNE